MVILSGRRLMTNKANQVNSNYRQCSIFSWSELKTEFFFYLAIKMGISSVQEVFPKGSVDKYSRFDRLPIKSSRNAFCNHFVCEVAVRLLKLLIQLFFGQNP